jgi:hypothetical protein
MGKHPTMFFCLQPTSLPILVFTDVHPLTNMLPARHTQCSLYLTCKLKGRLLGSRPSPLFLAPPIGLLIYAFTPCLPYSSLPTYPSKMTPIQFFFHLWLYPSPTQAPHIPDILAPLPIDWIRPPPPPSFQNLAIICPFTPAPLTPQRWHFPNTKGFNRPSSALPSVSGPTHGVFIQCHPSPVPAVPPLTPPSSVLTSSMALPPTLPSSVLPCPAALPLTSHPMSSFFLRPYPDHHQVSSCLLRPCPWCHPLSDTPAPDTPSSPGLSLGAGKILPLFDSSSPATFYLFKKNCFLVSFYISGFYLPYQ